MRERFGSVRFAGRGPTSRRTTVSSIMDRVVAVPNGSVWKDYQFQEQSQGPDLSHSSVRVRRFLRNEEATSLPDNETMRNRHSTCDASFTG